MTAQVTGAVEDCVVGRHEAARSAVSGKSLARRAGTSCSGHRRSTIDLGHNLGLRVVAEGVENQHAWQELSALGCDIAQGYFLGRALCQRPSWNNSSTSPRPGWRLAPSSEPDLARRCHRVN
jgi:EAL domain-containing protein (putative c-di-GMP-specific phosphodiesterase class I)